MNHLADMRMISLLQMNLKTDISFFLAIYIFAVPKAEININIGTLNKNSIEAMIIAGKKSNELGHVVLLDPVGAGASKLRTDTALRVAREIKLDVIRGNISEIKTIANGSGTTKGVDADVEDAVTEDNLNDAVKFIKDLSKRLNVIIAITGAIDLVSDGDKCYIIRK